MHNTFGETGKAFATLQANVRSFPAVNPLMRHQAGAVAEALSALGTSIRPLSRVDPLVRHQTCFQTKASATIRAGMWFQPNMDLLVLLERRL